MIHVTVGPTKEKFGIHQRLLCSESSFFKAALTGNFKEAKDGVVHLEDEEIELFTCFHEWLYTKRFIPVVIPVDCGSLQSRWLTLLKLYVFGDRRDIPRLQNDVINEMILMSNEHGAFNPVLGLSEAWKSTADSSLFHQFLVQFFVRTVSFKSRFGDNSENRTLVPPDFMLEVSITFEDMVLHGPQDFRTGGAKSFWRERCKYHVHDSKGNRPCKKDK